MTEEAWLTCMDPYEMLGYFDVHRGGSERKWMLFGCACCRRIWDCLVAEHAQYCVEIAEKYADGQATKTQRKGAILATQYPYPGTDPGALAVRCGDWGIARALIDVLGQTAARARDDFSEETWSKEYRAQAGFLRDIFGIPFRPVVLNSSWRGSCQGAVMELAEEIYEKRSFGQMPALADALDDAGCNDAQVLGHCRQTEPHVRGCWLLDMVLGKERTDGVPGAWKPIRD
jgi:hypothetical protein